MTDHISSVTPYKGLMPYSDSESDARFFFGREQRQDIITDNLVASRLTVFYGPSGVGKSSVLRAGVLYRLRKVARQTVEKGDIPEFVPVAFSSWRDDPVVELGNRIQETLDQLSLGITLDPPPDSGKLAESLRNLTAVAAGQKAGGLDLLIVLDQFEDYFLYHSKDEEDSPFAVELARIINDPRIAVNVLISIRDDALAKLDCFKGRIHCLFENRLSIEHLRIEAAREAIVKPLKEYNRLHAAAEPIIEPLDVDRVRAANGSQVGIEPALVEAVLKQVKAGQVLLGQIGRGKVKEEEGGESPADVYIETPYLQLVMTRLWEEEHPHQPCILRLETLEKLGGATRIVQSHLDKTLETLLPAEREIAARIFHHLVTPSGTKIAHTASDLGVYAGLSQDAIEPVLTSLANTNVRILRPIAPPDSDDESPGSTRYEIFHDVLASAVLDWRTRYVDRQKTIEAREQLQTQRQRTEMAAKSARRFRRLTLAFAVVSLLALATAAYALSKRNEAARNRAEAAKLKGEAEELKVKGERLKEENDKAQKDIAIQKKTSEGLIELSNKREAEANTAWDVARKEAAHAASEKANADSANIQAQALKVASQTDKLYLEAFRLSRSYDQRLEAIGKLNEVLTAYRKVGNHQAELATLFDTGRIYLELGQFDEAAKTFDQTLQISRGQSERASTLSSIGNIYQDAPPTEDTRKLALSYFNQALSLYESGADKTGQADTLVKIGQVRRSEAWYGLPENRSKAIKELTKALDGAARLYHEKSDFTKEARALYVAGDALFFTSTSYLDDALLRESSSYINRALTAFEAAGDRQGAIESLKRLVSVDQRLKSPEDMLKHRNALTKALESNNDLLEAAQVVFVIASESDSPDVTSYRLPKVELIQKSERLIAQWAATQLKPSNKDREFAASILSGIGYLYYNQLNQLVPARKAFDAALLEYRQVKGPPSQVFSVLNYLTAVARDQRDLSSQRTYLEQSVQEADQIVPTRNRAEALVEVGKRYMELNELNTSTKYFQRALELARGLDAQQAGSLSQPIEIKIMVEIGKYYVSVGNEETARSYFNQARQKQKSPADEAQSLAEIATFYAWRDNFQVALEYFELATQVCRETNQPYGCETYMLNGKAAVYRQRRAEGDEKKAEEAERRIRELETAPQPTPTPPTGL